MVRVCLTWAMLKPKSRFLDAHLVQKSQVPIHQNVIHEKYTETAPQNNCSFSYGYTVVLKTLEVRRRDSIHSNLGRVSLHSTGSETIVPGQKKVIEGALGCRVRNTGRWVTVESLKSASLPGGLIVTNELTCLPSKRSCHIPCILKKVRSCYHCSTKASNSRNAYCPECSVYQPSDLRHPTKLNYKAKLSFDFGTSLIPSKWKKRMTDK